MPIILTEQQQPHLGTKRVHLVTALRLPYFTSASRKQPVKRLCSAGELGCLSDTVEQFLACPTWQ